MERSAMFRFIGMPIRDIQPYVRGAGGSCIFIGMAGQQNMHKDLQGVVDYLSADASEIFPRYILHKEILQKKLSEFERDAIKTSKWYKQLAAEQWENGSWGRFHTQDTKAPYKQKFVTTEQALRRARQLSLDNSDPVIQKSIGLMERYLRGEEAWLDANEKHYGFEIAFKTLIAANLSLFVPQHPLLRIKREVCADNLSKAFVDGILDEDIWERENRKRRDIMLKAYMVYPVWLLQNNAFLREDVQKQYLSWLWNRKGGIYYVCTVPPSNMRSLEEKAFTQWLSGLENLCGFTLFSAFMNQGAAGHLLHEIQRLMYEDVMLPSTGAAIEHYSENRIGKNTRKNDMLLRILRILAKCH